MDNADAKEDNTFSDFTLAKAKGNKMQMLGTILVTGEEINSRECFQRSNGYIIIEET